MPHTDMRRVIEVRKWMVSAEGNKGVQMPSLGLSEPRARSQVSDASGDLLVTVLH